MCIIHYFITKTIEQLPVDGLVGIIHIAFLQFIAQFLQFVYGASCQDELGPFSVELQGNRFAQTR